MRRILFAATLFVVAILTLTTPVHADIGPKASLYVHVKGCDEDYSFELLTYELFLEQDDLPTEYAEPYHYYKDDYPDFFLTYLDEDNYAAYTVYSIPGSIRSEGSRNGTDTFLMNYIAPRTFKIALYIDETDVLIVSDIVETTLFESEVTWDLSGETFTTDQEGIGTLSGTIVGDPQGRVWTKTVVQTLIRVIVTVSVELGLLFLFGLRKKRLFIQVGLLNVVTQAILSAILITIYLTSGSLAYIIFLFAGEFFVVLTEFIVCLFIFKGHMPIWKTAIYVILANVTTMIIGINLLFLIT